MPNPDPKKEADAGERPDETREVSQVDSKETDAPHLDDDWDKWHPDSSI